MTRILHNAHCNSFRPVIAYVAASLVLALCGCGDFPVEGALGRSFNIVLERGVPILSARINNNATLRLAMATDVPFTLRKSANLNATKAMESVGLYDIDDTSRTFITFPSVEVYSSKFTDVGIGASVPLDGFLGASVLYHFSIRLVPSTESDQLALTFRRELSGDAQSKEELAHQCDPDRLADPALRSNTECIGVFESKRLGGDAEHPATRLVLPVCLEPVGVDLTDITLEANSLFRSGMPANALVATSLPVSVISASAFERLQGQVGPITPLETTTLHLPYGDEQVTRIQLRRIAVVSNETSNHGSCAERTRRQQLFLERIRPTSPQLRENLSEFNGSSITELSMPLDVVIVSDESPLMQGIRQELRPTVADVELFLGMNFFKQFETDFDYPGEDRDGNSRIVLRCASNTACETLPYCANDDTDPRCFE